VRQRLGAKRCCDDGYESNIQLRLTVQQCPGTGYRYIVWHGHPPQLRGVSAEIPLVGSSAVIRRVSDLWDNRRVCFPPAFGTPMNQARNRVDGQTHSEPARPDGVSMLHLAAGSPENQLCHADDAVHGRADFVAHVSVKSRSYVGCWPDIFLNLDASIAMAWKVLHYPTPLGGMAPSRPLRRNRVPTTGFGSPGRLIVDNKRLTPAAKKVDSCI
jgi:hypothetical protein